MTSVPRDLVKREKLKNGLVATRDYLAKPGHWTNDPRNIGGKTKCLMMALDAKMRRNFVADDDMEALYRVAVNLIREELTLFDPSFPDTPYGQIYPYPVIDWNDNPKRKKKEVIGLLDRVIEKVSA